MNINVREQRAQMKRCQPKVQTVALNECILFIFNDDEKKKNSKHQLNIGSVSNTVSGWVTT